MSLFDEDKDDRKEVKALGDRSKAPEAPDLKEWGREPRRGNPFALDDFSSGAPVNTTKP
jgi:hypothetical protein